MNKKFEELKHKLKKFKIEYIVAIFAIITVILFFLNGAMGESKISASSVTDVQQYVNMLEQKLCEHLSKIDGAGKVNVIISVKQSIETKIATEVVSTSGLSGEKNEESPILVSGKPIVLKEIYPEICGVIIIAKGAKDIKVKHSLLSATQVFLDITSEKIEILTMR